MNRLLRRLVAVAVIGFAVVGLGWAILDRPPSTTQERAQEISRTLKCPTCAGESIADSNALLSGAMRETVQEQVEQGRTPDEIREWFAQRYGDQILLEPPRRGLGWLLWGFPLVLVAAAALVLMHQRRTPRRGQGLVAAALVVAALAGTWAIAAVGPEHRAVTAHGDLSGPDEPIGVLRGAVADAPGDAQRRLVLATALERSGDPAGALAEYAAAIRLEPLDVDARYRYAFALTRDGDAPAAIDVLEGSLRVDDSHAPSLLLLGALLQDSDPDRGDQLLARFVELEPDHPAAAAIRESLAADGSQPSQESP